MAKQVKLIAQRGAPATGRSAVRKIKAQGAVPAVIYGGKTKPEPLQVSKRDISTILSHASGENILVELEIDGEEAAVSPSCRKCSIPRSGATFCMSIFTPSRWMK